MFKPTLFLTEHKVVLVAADSLIILNFCWYTNQIYFDLWFQEFALTYLIEIRSPLDFKSYALLSRWVLTLDLQIPIWFSVAFKNGGSDGLISNPPICWRRSILVIAKFVFAVLTVDWA